MPLLSVIVPFYNVELYIEECLESLRRQTLADLEVVLVDDGSSDGTRATAERFCAADPRFRLITQENLGLGRARNTGTAAATGELLTFVDSDDVVHPAAYELLTSSLRSSGSQFAISSAGRFNNLGVTSSFVHAIAITRSLVGTHITDHPNLVLDRMAWNKVYRRDFWDENGFEFPAMLMEDFPISIAAHTRARAVDVLDDVLYFWRERDGGEPSITQRSGEIGNLTDRYTSAMMVLDVAEPQVPASLPLLREHLCEIDVTAIVAALTVNTPEKQPEILGMAQRLSARLGAGAGARLPAFQRVQTAMIERADADGLRDLHAWAYRYGRSAAVQRHGRFRKRYYELLPRFGAEGIGREPYEVAGGTVPVAVRVEDVAWNGDVLDLRMLVDTAVRLGPKATVEIWLESKLGERVACPVDRAPRRVPYLGEDLAEVRTSIDPRAIAAAGGRHGFWSLRARVRTPDVDVEVYLDEAAQGRARYAEARPFGDRPDLVVQPYHGETGYGVVVRRPHALVDSCEALDGTLVLTGRLRAAEVGPEPRLELVGRHGADRSFPVEIVATGVDRHWTFRAEVPAEALAETPDYLTPIAAQITFDAHLDLGHVRRGVALADGFRTARVVTGYRTVTAARSMFGNLQLLDQRTAPEVDTIAWVGDSVLRFEGVWRGPQPLPDAVVVEHFEHPSQGTSREVPLEHDAGRYWFEIDATELVRSQLRDRDPFEGPDPDPWHLVLPFSDHLAPQVFDRAAVSAFPAPRVVEGARVRLELARNDIVRIGVGG